MPAGRMHADEVDTNIDLVVRLPRIDWAIGDVEKEQRWLPKLAPFLPLAIPVLPSHSRAGIMPANVSGP